MDHIETQAYMMAKMTRFIKYNRNLLHLDLTQAGLNQLSIRIIGISLRRARSLLSLHISENPGITKDLKSLLFERIRCKPFHSLKQTDIDSFSKSIHSILDKNASLKDKVVEGFEIAEISRI